jgi:hypothetical protein
MSLHISRMGFSQVFRYYRQFHTISKLKMPLNLSSVYPALDPEFQSFPSRRSVVHSTQGMIACTQPLAARCGLKILDAGGNAAVSTVAPI